MFKYVEYDIEAIQNLKLAKTNMQEDSEESMEYITGSAVRGAFIYKYIQKYGLKDINQGIHREKLFKGNIKFLNAYPKYGEKRSLPFLKCYFAPKEEIRKFKENNDTLEIVLGLDNSLKPECERVRLSEFVSANNDGETYTQIKVDRVSNLHINKQGTEKNILFRYESIKEGQVFNGIIKVKENYADEVVELLENSVIYVGGSKGSGYGKCRITNMKVKEENPEYKVFEGRNFFEKELYLVAMSDIIYKSRSGEYKTRIEEEFIKNEMGLEEVKFIGGSIETKNITGYNNKWNCRMPQIVGIKAGSVFKYRIDGDIDEGKMHRFMDRGIGERKTEGFGRFVIIDSLGNSKLYRYKREKDLQELHIREKNLYNTLSNDEKEQIQGIFNSIYEKRIENSVYKRVIDIDADLKNKKELSQSQWGKLRELFIELSYKNSQEGIKLFDEWRKKINNKMSTSFEQLQRVKVKDENIIDFLSGTVEKSIDIKTHTESLDVNKVEFGGFKGKIDSNFAYRTNMWILVELCKYQDKKGGLRDE